jgi:hypothetical protein
MRVLARPVMPAKAGIQSSQNNVIDYWIIRFRG